MMTEQNESGSLIEGWRNLGEQGVIEEDERQPVMVRLTAWQTRSKLVTLRKGNFPGEA